MPAVHNIFIKISDIDQPQDRKYQELIETIARQLEYTVLNSVQHHFQPQGFTAILLLSESHISIHTWPEDNFAILEMVTCKPFTAEHKDTIVATINTFLNTQNLDITINQ